MLTMYRRVTGARGYSRQDSKTGSNWRLRELAFVFCCFGSTSSRSSRFIREKNLLPSELARITVTTWSELHCRSGRAYTAFERDNFLCERTILRVRGGSSAKVKWLKSKLPRSDMSEPVSSELVEDESSDFAD